MSARGIRPARRTGANQHRVLGVGIQRSIAPQLDAFIRTIAEPISVACGLGVDSLAMLVEMFRRGIVPDLILFADTGGELPETLEYTERVLRPWLRLVGFPDLTVVRYRPKHGRYTTLEQNCLVLGVLPDNADRRRRDEHDPAPKAHRGRRAASRKKGVGAGRAARLRHSHPGMGITRPAPPVEGGRGAIHVGDDPVPR